jgi:hypothetical protein
MVFLVGSIPTDPAIIKIMKMRRRIEDRNTVKFVRVYFKKERFEMVFSSFSAVYRTCRPIDVGVTKHALYNALSRTKNGIYENDLVIMRKEKIKCHCD